VRINEIESNGGSPDDWVELVNTGKTSVDASGLVIKDNDDTHAAVLPSDSIISAGGYLVVEAPTLGFGLGAKDSVRLFATDTTTVIDSYVWTEHAATTYGRCPDGTGVFAVTANATKNAVNDCVAAVTADIRINEVESSGGTPGDWVELYNPGTTTVDLAGWGVLDNDDSHTKALLPAGAAITAGGFYVVEESTLGFGLGSADSARLFAPDGFTLVDTVSWTSHAATTYGICADGAELVLMTSSTKGAANDCGSPVRINEIESSDGNPGDWIELKNNGAASVDLSGFVVKDSDDTHTFVIPSGTSIAAGGYWVAEVESSYGLGKADSARLFAADGTLLDSHSWSEHAATTYGRCADGTGDFVVTAASTKGAANSCAGDLVTSPWPGSPAVATADVKDTFVTNMSGLAYESRKAGDVLWAAKNGAGALYRLVFNGTNWVPDADNGWSNGKLLHYTNGTGDVDAEGVALTTAGTEGGLFISSERNNSANAISRPSVLRYDATVAGDSLTATMEWNLTADLPVVGANAGLEGITWVPDSALVADGLIDEKTSALYDPATYADHGAGLFFVGLEANGAIYAYALNQVTGGYDRVATIDSGFTGVMDLEYEAETNQLWAVCDDTCDGRSAVLDIAQDGVADGKYGITTVFERPASMPNLNNEGFAITPQSSCVDGAKAVFWSDDTNSDGFAIRTGSINCTVGAPTDPTDPTIPVEPTDPTDPTTPTDPTIPVEPTDPTTPTDPTIPVEPTDPTTPTDPTDPTIPVEPTDPTVPVDPTDPTIPVDPTTPVEPTDPTIPVDPTNPAPVDPTNPNPVDPTVPVPVDPATPTVPETPETPSMPAVPVAPSSESLTEAARGSVLAPSSVVAGGAVTVTVGGQFGGDSVSVWLHSTPVLLDTTTVTASGTVRVVVPAATAAGAHRIAVVAADGTLIGWDDITVTAKSASAGAALASTGVDSTITAVGALLLLLAGATVLTARRRGRMES
jgi:hypothetical protein